MSEANSMSDPLIGSFGRQSEAAQGQGGPPEPDGPLVTLCMGQRCTALRDLSGTPAGVASLRATVRATRGAVLVSAGCLGPCALASLAAVGRLEGQTGQAGRTLWLSGVEQPARAEALRRWVGAGGPARLDRPDADLPRALRAAVVGTGPGQRLNSTAPPTSQKL